jgi:general secretion pathway protein F
MAVFSYRALDSRYLPTTGTIAADTPRQARDQLRAKGLLVEQIDTQIASQKRTLTLLGMLFAPGRRDAARIGQLVRQLATLLGVGSPLLESLDTLARQHTGSFRKVLLLLRDKVAAGSSLADAMTAQPMVFDALCVNLVRVGEDAGTLDATLQRLGIFKERSKLLKGKLTTAMLYPGIVLVVAVGISLFLMTFVVPNLLAPLLEQGRALPLPTRIVKGASDVLLTDGWWIVLVAVGAFGLLGAVLRTRQGRWAWDRLTLKLPVLGDLARKQAIMRIAVVMSTLLRSGVVFVRSLQIAQTTTTNRVMRGALNQCERAVAAGGDIGEALEKTRAFPPLVVHLFALGQQSGRLEEMLGELAETYDAEVTTAAQRLASILEPLLILMLAAVVLCIVLATMLPILEAGDVLQ